MAYKNFTVGEMVSTTAPWVTPGHPEREVLERLACTAPLLPEIEAVYGELKHTHTAAVELNELLSNLADEAGVLDGDHDGWARGIDSMLAGLIQVHQTSTGDAALAERLTSVRDKLFPMGMRVVTFSYREEAGQAVLTAERLSAEDRALLASIRAADASLLDWVNTWLEKARQLGEIENLRTIHSSKVPQPSPADAQRARFRWIRMIKAVMLMLEIARSDEPGVQDIIERVRGIERQVDRRAAGTGGAVPEPGDEPVVSDPGLEILTLDAAQHDEHADGVN